MLKLVMELPLLLLLLGAYWMLLLACLKKVTSNVVYQILNLKPMIIIKSLSFIGIHPMNISDAFGVACEKGVEILQNIAIPVELNDRESLLKSASTSLSSKVMVFIFQAE